MKRLVILPSAAKALRRHRAESGRILSKLEAYAEDPEPFANTVVQLSGSTARRLRIGDFRAIFEETDSEIVVTRIGPRGSVYD